MDTLHQNSFWCLFTLYWMMIGDIQGQQLCKNWNQTRNRVDLQIDTSLITGQNGMCSCRMTVDNAAEILVCVDNIQSRNCNTNIELVDSSFTFKCQNGKFAEFPPYYKNHDAGDNLWLVVYTTVASDQSMSGTLQIKTYPSSGGVSNPMFTIECYNPNTNISSPLTTSVTTSTTDQSTGNDASNGHTDTESTEGKSSPGQVAAVAGGVVAALFVMVTVISGVILLRRCQNHRLNQEPVSDIPPFETHPTYSGLVAGGNTTYDHIKHPPPRQ